MSIDNREEHHRRHPYLPERIIDNLLGPSAFISIVNWDKLIPDILGQMIGNVYNSRATCTYDLSGSMHRKNGQVEQWTMVLNRFYLIENSIAQRSGLYIFISHQKRDADTTRKIADYFITSGIDVYFDECDTKADRTRPYSVVSTIKTGIRNNTHMLCLLSQNALDSKWIPWEVGYGYGRTTVMGLTLKEISQSVLPEYLQIAPILRDTRSLSSFISNVLKRNESALINEGKLFAVHQSQHPLGSVLNWEL